MPHNVPAVWPEGWQLPLGVAQAEERAREARIIDERQARNARIKASLRIVPPSCTHQNMNVFQSTGTEDTETLYAECRSCKAWVVSTLYLSNDAPAETRPMTQKELDQFRALEDRRQRDEWSWEA